MKSATVTLTVLALMAPVAATGISVSTADTYVSTYGQATHRDQYNEWLGASPSMMDGLSWEPLVGGAVSTFTLETNVGDFWGTGDFEYFSLWIDWDRNGYFDAYEEEIDLDDYWFNPGFTSHEFDIMVPVGFSGATWMRSRFAFGQDLFANDALMGGPAYFGEVEDYQTEGPVIPEPATLLLLGTGLASIAAFRRRTRSSR